MADDKIIVWGHRGYSFLYPENTMLSFKKALESGADGIECDIQKTKDDRFVAIHDPFIANGNSSLFIAKATLSELKKIDLGNGEHIITLNELIEFFPEKKTLDIELKGDTITKNDCKSIYKIMEGTNKNIDYYICSFKISLLLFFIKKGVTVGYLTGPESLQDSIIYILRNINKIKSNYMSIPVQAFSGILSLITRFLVKVFKLFGFKFNFWTVNNPEQLKKIKGLGNIIITDKVGTFVKIRNGIIL